MSYLFDGVNDTMTGTFTSTYGKPVTLACFIKVTQHPVANNTFLAFGNNAASINDAYQIRTEVQDDRWGATARDASVIGVAFKGPVNVDGLWAGIVGVFTGNTLRDVYINALANTGQDTTATTVADVLQFIRLGESFNGLNDYAGKLAEVAIWNSVLGASDIDTYMRQTRRASSINSATLIGYWPLNTDNATQNNQGLDAGGALTVTSALFDNDHPGLGTTYQLMGQVAV